MFKSPQYRFAWNYDKGYAKVVSQEGIYGIISKKGELMFEQKMIEMKSPSDGAIAVQQKVSF